MLDQEIKTLQNAISKKGKFFLFIKEFKIFYYKEVVFAV